MQNREESYKQPHTEEFEFFGPHGTILTIISLPLVVLGLYFLCDDQSCSLLFNIDDIKDKIRHQELWILFQFFLSAVIPGKTVLGHALPIPSSHKLHYKINGLRCFAFSVIFLMYTTYAYGWSQWLWVATHYVQLAFSGIIFTSILSTILYIYS